MRLNSEITRLLFELSEVESGPNTRYLIGDGAVLRNNLLKLYRATKSKESHDLIIKIMNEAGYSWFDKLARSSRSLKPGALTAEKSKNTKQRDLNLVSEREFSSLLPVNELVH